MSCWACRTGSSGKRMELSVWFRSPARSTSSNMLRLIPASPPTPFSEKPKPSWIGVNSTVTMKRNEKPGLPSGSLVSSRPMTLIWMVSSLSSSTPAYSPLSTSKKTYPPPTTAPASISRPRPLGGLKAKPRLRLPRLPGGSVEERGVSSNCMPTRSTVAATGPISKPPVRATCKSALLSLPARMAM